MISEDEARALWRRAAELQARAEDRETGQVSLAPVAGDESALSVEEVVAAAEGAGIAAEHIRVALAERSLPYAAGRKRGYWTGLLRFLAGYESDAVERAELITASPQEVRSAVSELLSRQPYAMTAERASGDDPPGSGMLVYRLSDSRRKKFGIPVGSAFERDINTADGKYLLVTVREEDGDATRLSVRMPLLRRGENVALFAVFAAASGWVGATLVSYLIPWTGAPSVLSALIPGVTGAVGIVIGVGSYRQIYRWATRKGEAALERLLQAIAFEARGTGRRSLPQVEE